MPSVASILGSNVSNLLGPPRGNMKMTDIPDVRVDESSPRARPASSDESVSHPRPRVPCVRKARRCMDRLPSQMVSMAASQLGGPQGWETAACAVRKRSRCRNLPHTVAETQTLVQREEINHIDC